MEFYDFYNLFDDELKEKLLQEYGNLDYHTNDHLKEKIKKLCDIILFLKQRQNKSDDEHGEL